MDNETTAIDAPLGVYRTDSRLNIGVMRIWPVRHGRQTIGSSRTELKKKIETLEKFEDYTQQSVDC